MIQIGKLIYILQMTLELFFEEDEILIEIYVSNYFISCIDTWGYNIYQFQSIRFSLVVMQRDIYANNNLTSNNKYSFVFWVLACLRIT